MKRFFLFSPLLLSVALADPPDPAALIVRADAAYMQRPDLHQAKTALQLYQQASTDSGTDPVPSWKASRVAWWIGENSTERAERLQYFQQGITLAKEALRRDPNSVEAHFWLGGNYGSYGETKGIFKSLALVAPIRKEMESVRRLNDRYLGGGVYRVLGVVDYKVPAIVGGDKKRAREELEKALAMDPHDPFTHYYLAEFHKLMGERGEARKELALLQALSVPEDSLPELHLVQKKGEKLLAQLP